MKVPASFCDNTAHLGIVGIFSVFMDMASEHGGEMGLGMDDMNAKGLIWLATKTKVRIFARPKMMQNVTVASWPEKPGALRCNRYYKIYDGDTVFVEGKTEWVMLDREAGRPVKLAGNYPEMEHCEETVCDGAFFRPSKEPAEQILGEYIVRSQDIDLSQHMNNVEYIRAALTFFSCNELESKNFSEIEVAYQQQCYEGERLQIGIRALDGSADDIDLCLIKENGDSGAVLRLTHIKED